MPDPITIVSLVSSSIALGVMIFKVIHDKVITSSCVIKDMHDNKAEELTKQLTIIKEMHSLPVEKQEKLTPDDINLP